MSGDSLGDRMKSYESISRNKLMCRTPVILRLDGKAFHSYTKQRAFKDAVPFSNILKNCFTFTTDTIIRNIQGSRLAFFQSDEVSILITDWKKLNTSAWFDYVTQKMTSVAASIFTYHFNNWMYKMDVNIHPAFFDARVFNVPFEEVANYFIWRQQDAVRNSIQMLARSKFSHKQLHKRNTGELQDMLMEQYQINWNDIETKFKRGSCITSEIINEKTVFNVDNDIPIFTQDREFIEKYLK